MHPEILDLGNRLYGPYSFGAGAHGGAAAIGSMPIEADRAPVEQMSTPPAHVQTSPSVSAPSNTAAKIQRRLEKLGYG